MSLAEIKSQVKFGTDGWRGVISDNFTFKNVSIVAQAISEWVNKEFQGKRTVSVGYDARFLSREYAEIVSCILAKNNIQVYLSDRMVPTPSLSFGTRDLKCVAGIMITASHNPAKFNGIKIKTAQGGGAGKDVTDKVEKFLAKTPVKTMPLAQALKEKKIKMHNFNEAYLKFMKNYVNLSKIKKAKFKVIQDVMHGSGGRILEDVLKGGQLKVELMRADVNPSFGGVKPEPIADYLPELLSRVKKEKFDIGLVLDGDADRVGAVAPGGEFVNPQRILGLVILHLVKNHGRTGSVVKTICGSAMYDHMAAKFDLTLHETPVGFKYISDFMVKEKVIAGGEEAGGIGVQDYIPERDGTLVGLLLLEMMVDEKKNLKQLLDQMEKEFGRYYYLRADVDIKVDKKKIMKLRDTKSLLGQKVIDVKDYDGIKLICEDESWLMFRPSGTEPLVRVYSEAKTLKRSQALVNQGEKIIKKLV